MTSNYKIHYNYLVYPISNGDKTAYKAIIPAFNNSVIFGENMDELLEGIYFLIESEIEYMKKKKMKVPTPDANKKFSGKIALRINPELHEKLILEAKANQTSLNKYIEEKLSI